MTDEIKVLGPKTGYIEILNHYTQQEIIQEASGSRRSSPLRPSSAGKDARELAYEFMEYRGYANYPAEPITPELHRLFKLGHQIEKHLFWEFKDAFEMAGGDIEVRYQQQVLSFFKLPDGSIIEGSCDGVFIARSKKFGAALVDIKSKNDKFSSYFKSKWDETSEQLSEMKTVHKFGDDAYWVEDLSAFLDELGDYFFAMNFLQLNMYFFDEHEFLKTRGVDHCAIIQYNKVDSRLREIRFKPSKELFEKVRDKFVLVQSKVDETKDPTSVPRENVLGSAACAFSKYRKYDWPEDTDALKAHFKTYPPKAWPKDMDRLPVGEQPALRALFDQFEKAQAAADQIDKIQQKIVTILDNLGVSKVKLDNDRVYQTKRLKSGGPAGKGQIVLRRGKL